MTGGAAPDPQAWQVAVRWLPWRPRWRRRSLRWWTGDLLDFDDTDDTGFEQLVPPVIKILLGLALLTIGLLVTAAFWVAVAAGIVGAAFARIVLLQPFLVEATHPAGEWAGWWVVGWGRARATRGAVLTALHAGTPVDDVPNPTGALDHPDDASAPSTSTTTPTSALPARFDDSTRVLGVVRGVLLAVGVVVAGATWFFADSGWIVAIVYVMLAAITVLVFRETGDAQR